MPKPLWNGDISFGLVSIPVELYSASRDRGIHFHMVSPDGSCRLRRKLVCPETGKEYDFNDTARSIEIAPDQFVMVDPEELKAFRPEKGDSLELEQFVKLEEIDPILFRSPYYLLPKRKGEKPYQLLHHALEQSGRIGLGQFIMRQKEYLACIRPVGELLSLETLLYADEVVAAKEIEEEPRTAANTSAKELTLAKQLIESLTQKFNHKAFRDHYREELAKFLEEEAKSGAKKRKAPKARPKKADNVLDLSHRLRESLKRKRGKHAA